MQYQYTVHIHTVYKQIKELGQTSLTGKMYDKDECFDDPQLYQLVIVSGLSVVYFRQLSFKTFSKFDNCPTFPVNIINHELISFLSVTFKFIDLF